jgi:hypothetical protein
MRPLVRPRHGWEKNIETDLKEQNTKLWAGVFWLRIRDSGFLLLTW